MIPGGTSYEGMRVESPDGIGRISKVLNPDVALVELTSREKIKSPKGEMVYPFAKFDLSELKAIDKPLPLPGSDEALAAQEAARDAQSPEVTPAPEEGAEAPATPEGAAA